MRDTSGEASPAGEGAARLVRTEADTAWTQRAVSHERGTRARRCRCPENPIGIRGAPVSAYA